MEDTSGRLRQDKFESINQQAYPKYKSIAPSTNSKQRLTSITRTKTLINTGHSV
jgi:hypothetical protein